MLLRSKLLKGILIFSLAAICACRSNPAAPTGDTSAHLFAILPDSATVPLNSRIIFSVSPGPAPFPKPYTMTWRVDTMQFVQTSTDSLLFTFTKLGKHSISVVYTDLIGKKRDSTSTIITVIDTTSNVLTGLGAFRVVINHDSLDRAKYQDYCSTDIVFTPYTGGQYYCGIDLYYSRTRLGGDDEIHVQFNGFCFPATASIPIVTYDTIESNGAFVSEVDSNGVQFNSINNAKFSPGLITFTKFDTIHNLVSGTFRFYAVKARPSVDPSSIDTVVGSFVDVGIGNAMFGQGNMTATINGFPFQPILNGSQLLVARLDVGTNLLVIEGEESVDSGVLDLNFTINTPQIGTFTFGDGKTPGTVYCNYHDWRAEYDTRSPFTSGSLTITSYDPANRRLSGTFTASPGTPNTTNPMPITNGVIDNLGWVQE